MLKLILPLLLSVTALAQQQRVLQGEIMEGQRNDRNYIKNPSCLNNTLGVATTAGTATITRATGGSAEGRFSKTECQISVSNPNTATIEFDTYTMETKLHGQNCEVTAHIGHYDTNGNAPNIFARAVNANGLQTEEQTITPASTTNSFGNRRGRKYSFVLPCGDAATAGLNPLAAPKLQIRVPLTSLATIVSVSDVTSGEVTSIGQFSAVSDVVNAGAMTIGAVTTPPTKATTRQIDSVTYVKEGKYAYITYRYSANPATGSAAGSGTYLWSLPAGLSIDTTIQPTTGGIATDSVDRIAQGSIPADVAFYSNSGPTGGFAYYVAAYNSTQFFVRYQQLGSLGQGFVGSAAFPLTDVLGFRITIKVPIQGWSASQSAAAANQTDYGWTAYTPTFTGLGTVTNIECFHSRTSQNLNIRCKGTAGTPTATEARVSLPGSISSAGTSLLPTITYAGTMTASGSFNGNGATNTVLIEPNITYLTFGRHTTGASGFTKFVGTSLLGAGETFGFFASIPISGWEPNQRAPTLIGSVTSNAVGAMRVEYANLSATGVVSNESSDWINGNCTNAVPNVCTFVSGTFSAQPVCHIIRGTTGFADTPGISAISSTSVSYSFHRPGTGELQALSYITCIGPR